MVLQNVPVLHSTINVVLSLFQSVANFLSPYLVDFLCKLAPIVLIHQQTNPVSSHGYRSIDKKRAKTHKHVDDASAQLHLTLQSVLSIIAKKTPSRLLIPAFSSCYQKIVKRCPLATTCLVAVANTHLNSLNKKVLSMHSSPYFAFYMEALDFRSVQHTLQLEDIAKIEDQTLEGVINLFLKLPEEQFQVLYHKLFTWGCSAESSLCKSTTFYRCINILTEKLKSLFTSLAVDLLPHFAKMFEVSPVNYQENEDETRLAAEYRIRMSNGLQTLTTLLQADPSFVNQERFDLICQPLVNEVQKVIEDGDQAKNNFDEYVSKFVVPLIGELAACSNNNIAWQPLHNQVLMKMRHNVKKVRMFALDAILLIAEKLGQDYMAMIPDTIPFLAELMEDENADVEKHCHRVTTRLEEVLGESLQKFF
uniref:HEAT repeat-containing protein 1 n=1 Tax=Phallusia mammillata TaxID=59560 RepID=A0A6F9DF50_9ASCI|nr:HEAT repeat-containing protein 1 [Phallusia mammillata]